MIAAYQLSLAFLGVIAYINGDTWESFVAASFVCAAFASVKRGA